MTQCTLIIFGITGDLSRRKIIPALYRIIKDKKLDNCAIIGAALDKKTIEEVLNASREFIVNIDEDVWQKFVSLCSYIDMDLTNENEFKKLKDLVEEEENKRNLNGNRLVYCSVGANFFDDITKNCVKSGLIKKSTGKKEPWYRIVYEKPFGKDLESAKELNKIILDLIDESQVYRIDHYLSKDIVENIVYTRFTNRIFEPLWSNYHIESIQIELSESIGINGRGSYYDKFGAIKDVVQNHMLQLLALVTMDTPKQLTGQYIQDCKAQILKNVEPAEGILGQYEGYQDEEGVKAESKAETFVVLKLFINDHRWAGVPIYLRTGKYLDKKETKIKINFKSTHCLLTKNCPTASNALTISIYPNEGIFLELNVKRPGKRDEVIPVNMEFCYDCLFSPNTPEAYENILCDIIDGDRSMSVRVDEIEYSWQIIDQIKKLDLPLYHYKKGTKGPEEIEIFAKNNGIRWM